MINETPEKEVYKLTESVKAPIAVVCETSCSSLNNTSKSEFFFREAQ